MGTYKRVFEHMGLLGHHGTSGGVQMHGHLNIWGCQVNNLKEVILNSFYFGKMLGVMKELILNSFYLGRVWR